MRFWAFGTVTRRARTQLTLLLVVLLVAVMAGTLVSGLAVLVSASERFGLPAALERVDPADTEVTFGLTLAGREIEPALAAVDEASHRLLGPLPASRSVDAASEMHEVGIGLEMLVYFASRQNAADHVRLTEGTWPTADSVTEGDHAPEGSRDRTRAVLDRIAADGEPDDDHGELDQTVGVAIPQSLATRAKLRIGDTFVAGEAFGVERTRAVVTAVYTVDDPEDGYWRADPLRGTTRRDDFYVPRTNGTLTAPAYGPLLTAPEAFAAGALPADTLDVGLVPDFASLPPEDLVPLLERSRSADDTLQATLAPAVQRASVTTELPQTLQRLDRYRYVTRTGVIIVALLLVVLALAALLLATRLLAERRFTEQSLMRARGASGRQLLRAALIEATLLAAIAAAASPLLARWVYTALAAQPAFQRAGLDRDPGVPAGAWYASAATAVAFVLVLISPLLRRSTTFVEQEQSAARQDRRSMLQRSGIDLGLLVLAAVAYWQLRHYDSPLVTVDGRPRLDPVLVVGPALALLAGALVAVRIVPLVSRRMETLAHGARSIVLPLAAWEVGRRPQRAIGAVLLLTLALAIGTFSLAYLATWQESQTDQADFRVGADVRITPAAGLEPLAQADAVRALPSADDAAPLLRATLAMGASDDTDFVTDPDSDNGLPVDVLAGDPRRLGELLRGRTLEPGGENRDLITALPRLATDTEVAGLALPGRPTGLRLRVSLTAPESSGIRLSAAVRAVVEDAAGVRQVIGLGFVPADDARHVVQAAVPGAVAGDETRPEVLSTPLRLIGVQVSLVPEVIDFDSSFFAGGGLRSTIDVDRLAVLDADGDAEPVGIPEDFSWSSFSTGDQDAVADPVAAGGRTLLHANLAAGSDFSFRGAGRTDIGFVRWERTVVVPAVADRALLRRMRAEVGDQISIKADGWAFPVTIVAAVDAVPSTAPDRSVLVMDGDLLTRALIERGTTTELTDEWWVGRPDEATALALGEAVTRERVGTAVSRAGLAREFAEQPLRVGFQGALWLVIGAAAAFAAVGFAMHTTVAIRLRRVEFSQLRALGITRRALTRVVATENVLLCAIGVGTGIGLGVLLGWMVGPMVSLAADGSAPVPAVLVVIPWATIALLALEVVAILVLVVLVVTRVLRRSVLGSVLRLGDER